MTGDYLPAPFFLLEIYGQIKIDIQNIPLPKKYASKKLFYQ